MNSESGANSTPKKANRRRIVILLGLLGTAIAGCDAPEASDASKPIARPVSYVTLAQSDPGRQSLVAGSVESWKKEMVGFQVGGRVRFVREPGMNIRGRLVDESGEILEPGTVMGSLENERYRLRVEEAEARVASIAAEAQAVSTDIERTIPSQLREVQAEYDRAKTELERQQRLLKRGAGTQKRVDDAAAKFKSAEAQLAQLRARRAEKQAQLAAIEAQVREAEEVLQQAKIDLADTELFSPFNGQISKIHVIPGGYVERGQPVATLQMMDPMKVQVAVSADTDRDVNFNDLLKIYAEGEIEPLNGWVWNKDTAADASTRTFTLTLLVRNRQVEIGLPPELKDKALPRANLLWNLEAEHDDGRAPFFTNVDTLHEDEQGHFVWKVEGLTIADMQGDFDPVFQVRKVRVKPGERRLRYLQVFTFRELADLGGLDPKTDLLTAKLPADVKDGDRVFLSRKRWMLRPGELVRVALRQGRVETGYYVPAQAVIKDGDGHHVYTVEEQANGEERAKRIDVRPGASAGAFQAIEAVADGALADGLKLIVDGAQYLRDGDAVNAFFEAEVNL